MNILMMTNTYFPMVGGLEQSVHSFSEEFKSLGHEVLIVTPTFGGAPKEEPGVIRIDAIQKFKGTVFSVNFPVSGVFGKYAMFNGVLRHKGFALWCQRPG